MRRFSQRNSLVTLSDINITPLLDLAFVLLIIFVITTPLLEQGLDITLPQGGQPDPPLRKEDFRTVEVGKGFYLLNSQQFSIETLRPELQKYIQVNPDLKIFIRADKTTPWDDVFKLMDVCADLGISVRPRSESPKP